MKKLAFGIGALGAFVVLVNPSLSGGDKDLRAIIDKGIKAQGGAANIAKFESSTAKGSGKFYGFGEGVPYAGEFIHQGHDKMRVQMDLNVMGKDIKVIVIVNGDKGWIKADTMLMEMSAEEVAEEKEGLYAEWVTALVPLEDKAYTLAALGETKVEEKAAVGIRVSKKGHRDVNLYFDKASGLVVKCEHMVKDVKAGGKEMTQESYFSDFKEFAGAKLPTKVVVKRDGSPFIDAVTPEIRPEKQLDRSLFEKP
ncbi:MAG: hypothetical protein HY040_16655 [Planctomycetes bacterium]|nr:hypothetical protein [Planctomycetota bacterium]